MTVTNAPHVGEREVRDVMISPEENATLSTEIETKENFGRMAECPHTRSPRVGEELTDFEGIIYAPVLERHREESQPGDLDRVDLAVPPMTLSADASVSDPNDRFQTENQALALVVEHAEVVGTVTIMDLLESITGGSEDPSFATRSPPDGTVNPDVTDWVGPGGTHLTGATNGDQFVEPRWTSVSSARYLSSVWASSSRVLRCSRNNSPVVTSPSPSTCSMWSRICTASVA